jgi:hypothetical protein
LQYRLVVSRSGAQARTLKGSFTGSSFRGTIRQESIVATCDTYTLAFTARR